MPKKNECKRCDYQWWPRIPGTKPIRCPRCGNPNWQKEKPQPAYLKGKDVENFHCACEGEAGITFCKKRESCARFHSHKKPRVAMLCNETNVMFINVDK